MKCNCNKNFSGIYCILNIITQQIYIGSGINIRKRYERHLLTLKENRHFNLKLQRSFNKYLENNFKFIIIELCNENILIEREQYYIDNLNPYYNINKIANQMNPKGTIRDRKIVDKISKALLGKKLSPEHILKLSLAKKGKPSSKKYTGKRILCFNKKTNEPISEYLNGRHAAEILNTDPRHVYKCLKYPETSHKNLKFKYI